MKIVVPADVQFFRPVRLAVGAVGTMVGFDMEAMEDLRIGVDELCGTLLQGGLGTTIEVVVTAEPGARLHVSCTTALGDGEVDVDRRTFSERILSVVADAYGIEATDGRLVGWLERSVEDGRGGADSP
jgi:hypothetical protein